MRAGESFHWGGAIGGAGVAPGTLQYPDDNNPNKVGPLVLQGGTYEVEIDCTGTPALAVQKLGPDGATFTARFITPDAAQGTPAASLIASGASGKLVVPPGLYRVVVATSTANFVSLTRIPMSE